MQQDGRLSVNGFLARLAGRFGQASPPPEEPRER
jgi:hypothetical protein